MDLRGRHILVTGASSGIGRSVARLLHRLGARLSLVDRDEAGFAAVCADVRDGAPAVPHGADVSVIEAIPALAGRCVEASGRPDTGRWITGSVMVVEGGYLTR